MAGLMFYILNDWFPKWDRRRKAMAMVAPKLLALYSKIDWTLTITRLEGGLNKELWEITLDDCKFANQVNLEKKKVPVNVYVRINN